VAPALLPPPPRVVMRAMARPNSARTQFVNYVAVGAVGTVLHYAVLALAVQRGHWAPWVGSGLGAVLGAQLAYAGNAWLTFRSQRTATASWWRFQATAAVGAVLGMGIVAGATRLGLHYLLAQAMATLVVLCVGFAINRHWTFGGPKSAPR
jgi:putative flippase GtrA